MIISASRRTDIPAFFSPWFFHRLDQGFAMVRNPMNPLSVKRISLSPDSVDCFVFWTKNPRKMMNHLDQLKEFSFYFLFSITPYGPELEKHLPPKEEVIDTFIELSERIGKEKVIWRYDPIIISDSLDECYHRRCFEALAQKLHPFTDRCIISFLDMYKKCERNLKGFNIRELTPDEMIDLAGDLYRVAEDCGFRVFSCAEDIDFSCVGIPPGKCIDDELIGSITGSPLTVKKDKCQRKTCGCVESIDIGAYNTCGHNCLYCYANSNAQVVQENLARYNPASLFL